MTSKCSGLPTTGQRCPEGPGTLGVASSAGRSHTGRRANAVGRRPTRALAPVGLLAALLSPACGPGTLADAADHRLTVEDAARVIAEHSTVAVDSQVVRVVAELWVDYTLLAAHLEADTTLGSLDVALVVEQPLQELMLDRLRDAVIDVDTVVTDEELTERFAQDLPGARATASQVLILLPPGATVRQRDSVLAVASALHDQLAGGADFAEIAARHSGDPGSGSRGGSMGTFGRGEMLAPIDSAVFGLRPGELSGPVETRLGYHLLRLDALSVPELSEVGAEFRARIQRERMGVAEAAYIARLDSVAGLDLADDGLQLARALLETAPTRLSRRAAERPLLTWTGGTYTAGDFLEVARVSPDGFADGLLAAPDDELRALLRRLAQQDLLVAEARERGFDPPKAQVDSVSAEARTTIRDRADAIGLIPRPAAGGAATDGTAVAGDTSTEGAATVEGAAGGASPTVEELVHAALVRVVSGRQEIVPLGGVTFLLRETGAWRIDEARIGATVALVGELQSR